MTEKRKMVSIEVPEDWADAVKKSIADVDVIQGKTRTRVGRHESTYKTVRLAA